MKQMGEVMRATCDRYLIKRRLSEGSSYHDWALIILDGTTLFVHSDYGNWSYYWSSPGCGFREFLCKIDSDYLLGKLLHGQPKKFNSTKTVARIMECVRERVADGEYLQREAAGETPEEIIEEAAETLAGIEASYEFSADLFISNALDEFSWLFPHLGEGIPVMELDPQCAAFVERLWPLFVAELREELAAVWPLDEY